MLDQIEAKAQLAAAATDAIRSTQRLYNKLGKLQDALAAMQAPGASFASTKQMQEHLVEMQQKIKGMIL